MGYRSPDTMLLDALEQKADSYRGSSIKEPCWYFAATRREGRFLLDKEGKIRASDKRWHACRGLIDGSTLDLYTDEHIAARELGIRTKFGVPEADITVMMNDMPPQPPVRKRAA